MRQGKVERERHRERERERQTDRQRERQRDRERDRETERERVRGSEREGERECVCVSEVVFADPKADNVPEPCFAEQEEPQRDHDPEDPTLGHKSKGAEHPPRV